MIGLVLSGEITELTADTFRETVGLESENCLYRFGCELVSFLTGLGRLNWVLARFCAVSLNRAVGWIPCVDGFFAKGREGGVWTAGEKSSIAVYITCDLMGENGTLGGIGGAREYG